MLYKFLKIVFLIYNVINLKMKWYKWSKGLGIVNENVCGFVWGSNICYVIILGNMGWECWEKK